MGKESGPYKIRCYYDVLEVERTASDDDIRQAYRKLARKWHPDKNLDNAEEADLRFKELQNAYGVLSDPNERAWYDSHREAILRGGDPTEGGSFDGINLWEYFNTECFDSYDDDPESGFYPVYKRVFDTLAAEEEKLDETYKFKAAQAPTFGTSKSDITEVNNFYNFWLNFTSVKSFAWKDMYRLNDAPNRQIRRLMEKENKKEREKGRRAFTDLVRKLVEFVRKKDRRVSEYLKAERAKKLEAEKKRTAQKAEQKRQHELDREVYQRESDAYLDSIDFSEADHEMLGIKSPNKRKAEKQAEEGSDQVPDEFSDEDVEHQHYCVACRKRFKSEKQWQNHEKSKKHKENVALLRTELLLDEEIEQFLEDQHELDEQLHSIQHQAEETPEPMPASAAPEDVDEEGLDENDPNVAELLSKFKLTSLNQQEKPADAEAPAAAAAAPATATQADDDDDEEPSAPVHKTVESDQEHSDDGVDEDFFLQSMLSKAKQKKQNKQAKKAQQRNAFAALMEEHKQDMEEFASIPPPKVVENDDDDEEEENEEDEKPSKAPAPTAKKSAAVKPEPVAPAPQQDKKGQKKRRRKDKSSPAAAPAAPTQPTCRVCSAVFVTRNELFQHLQETGHSTTK